MASEKGSLMVGTDSAVKLTTLPASSTAADIKAVTDRDGGVIVEDVLSAELLARINADVDPYLEGMDPVRDFGAMLEGGGFMPNTKRLEGLVEKSDAIVDVILDDRYQEWVASVLTWCSDYQYNAGQVIEIGPGEPAQTPHRDESTWPQVAGGEHDIMASCMYALTDFTEESGATRVVLGSHRREAAIDPYSLDVDRDTIPVVMKAGSAFFFTGMLVHGGGANRTSDYFRRGMSITCSLGWLKPEEAQTLAVSLERARALPKRMRELCNFAGYRAYGDLSPICSHRLDLVDPYTVLFGEPR
jgi:ectoine hydroxylase-related dioxygenase (phytanoyl-CoA dioxygenase family)